MLTRVVLLVVLLAVGSCDQTPTDVPTPPPDGASEVDAPPCDGTDHDLGSPFTGGTDRATFTTGGGPLWVTATSFSETGVVRSERASIHVGPADVRPELDRRSGEVEGAVLQVGVDRGNWVALDLDAGQWWLWSSAGDVVLRACDDDVRDVGTTRAADG